MKLYTYILHFSLRGAFLFWPVLARLGRPRARALVPVRGGALLADGVLHDGPLPRDPGRGHDVFLPGRGVVQQNGGHGPSRHTHRPSAEIIIADRWDARRSLLITSALDRVYLSLSQTAFGSRGVELPRITAR